MIKRKRGRHNIRMMDIRASVDMTHDIIGVKEERTWLAVGVLCFENESHICMCMEIGAGS